jgi:serine/threonine protein kinase
MLYNLDGDGQLGEIVMADFGDAHVHDMTLTPQQAADAKADTVAHTRKSAHFTYPSCCDYEGGVRSKPTDVDCHPFFCAARYAAPEVRTNPQLGVAGKHADSYTVGAMLLHLIYGKPPDALEWVGCHPGLTAEQLLATVLHDVEEAMVEEANGVADEVIMFTLRAVLKA